MLPLFSLIILVLDAWAIINILGSSANLLAKLFWTVLVLIFPIIGFLIWYFVGPKRA